MDMFDKSLIDNVSVPARGIMNLNELFQTSYTKLFIVSVPARGIMNLNNNSIYINYEFAAVSVPARGIMNLNIS